MLAELFLVASGTLVSGVGLLLCYVGIFPAIALLAYAHHHLDYQLYELYLERGGVPVQRKEKTPPAAAEYHDAEPSSPHVMRPLPDERSTDVMRPSEDPYHDY